MRHNWHHMFGECQMRCMMSVHYKWAPAGIACINSSRLIKDVLYCKRKAQLWKQFAAWLISRARANCPLSGNRSYSSTNSHNCPVCGRGDSRQPCRSRTGQLQTWPFVKAASQGAGQCLWRRGPYSKHLWLGIPYYLCRDLTDFWTSVHFVPDVFPSAPAV